MKEYIKLNNEVMQKVDGFYQLEKDKEAVEKFEAEVEVKMMKFNSYADRINWLINNDYYVNLLEMYPMEVIENIAKEVFAHGFKFQSYMAISKFYSGYALKTNDKKQYLEYYEANEKVKAERIKAKKERDLLFRQNKQRKHK